MSRIPSRNHNHRRRLRRRLTMAVSSWPSPCRQIVFTRCIKGTTFSPSLVTFNIIIMGTITIMCRCCKGHRTMRHRISSRRRMSSTRARPVRISRCTQWRSHMVAAAARSPLVISTSTPKSWSLPRNRISSRIHHQCFVVDWRKVSPPMRRLPKSLLRRQLTIRDSSVRQSRMAGT